MHFRDDTVVRNNIFSANYKLGAGFLVYGGIRELTGLQIIEIKNNQTLTSGPAHA